MSDASFLMISSNDDAGSIGNMIEVVMGNEHEIAPRDIFGLAWSQGAIRQPRVNDDYCSVLRGNLKTSMPKPFDCVLSHDDKRLIR
jgi:hypothetical protein